MDWFLWLLTWIALLLAIYFYVVVAGCYPSACIVISVDVSLFTFLNSSLICIISKATCSAKWRPHQQIFAMQSGATHKDRADKTELQNGHVPFHKYIQT